MGDTKRLVTCIAFALCTSGVSARAQFVSGSANQPPAGGEFSAVPFAIQQYFNGGHSYLLTNLSDYAFSTNSPLGQNLGNGTTAVFSSTFAGDLSIDGGAAIPFTTSATDAILYTRVSGTDGSPFGGYSTQFQQLNAAGLPGGEMLRISPSLTSAGQTTIADAGGGLFSVTSFFDIFTDISTDGGATWTSSSSSDHIQLNSNRAVPEPGSIALLFSVGIVVSARNVFRRMRS